MANINSVNKTRAAATQIVNTVTETLLVPQVGIKKTVFGNESFDLGRAFGIHLRGVVAGGTASTAQFKLYAINGANKILVANFVVSGAAVPAAGSQFNLTAHLSWDAVSQTVNGYVFGHTAGTLTPLAAITTLTGIVAAELTFEATVTFGAALATNAVRVSDFSIEQL